MRSILIAGYPYVKENYLKTFDYYPEGDSVFFLLPKTWKAKNGKLNFNPPRRNNIYTANAYFFHSNYPVIGGLLKGWMPSFPLVLFKIRRKIDIVYSPSEPILLTTFYQGFWTKFFGKKHIIFTWENIPYENKFGGLNLLVKKFVLKLNLAFCDGVICGNTKARGILSHYTKEPITVIPLSGVDTDFYRREGGSKKIENSDLTGKIVFNFSGAIGYRKGLHVILGAFKKVSVEIPSAHLLIVGSGEYEDKISELIDKLGLNKNLTLISWLNRESLKKAFNASDVFLYPSLSYGGWEEQFGYSMAEASLMELPVITTKTGSTGEVVLEGQTGLLVEAGNEEQLASAMIRLGRDSELRKKMGQAGRKYIEDNFSYSQIAGKFYKFFHKLT